ncbi:ATP-binding cassette domain-containing protein [Cryptosporangium minutisporangium]|uniref:ATP-binding cassette domain-containing protein n=1 Tax=Cryptosporangium minutisporangium TaxID=113569 RepID=A0ABP6SPQ0_9ACTN
MTLLQLTQVRVSYPGRGWRGRPTEVLAGVDLALEAGQTHGLVGESGSGKTTIGRAILGLVPISGGAIHLDGVPIHGLRPRQRRALSRDVQVVFQDPYTSLNPSRPIGDTLAEPLYAQGRRPRTARDRVAGLLERVGLPADAMHRLPREFSGGQRQRIAIARALAIEPRLIVCDEPVSALDLTTQRTVLDLLLEIQRDTGVAYLFISHDLAVVRHVSHVVSVIRHGEIVESGPAATVTGAPQHSYTRQLLLSAPVADPVRQRARREAYEREFAR